MRVVDAWHNRDGTRTPRYGRGKRWIAVWRETPGKPQRKKSFDRKSAAEAYIALKRREQEDRAAGRPRVEATLYRDWVDEWVQSRAALAPGTRVSTETSLRLHILPTFGAMYLHEITYRDVTAWVGRLAEDYAPRTVKRVAAYFNASLNEAVKAGLIRENPGRGVRLPEIRRARMNVWSVEQCQAVIDALPAGVFQDLATVAASTGLRVSELLAVGTDTVDLGAGVIRVSRQVSGTQHAPVFVPPKTRESDRVVAVGPATLAILARRAQDPGLLGMLFWETQDRALLQSRAGGVLRDALARMPWATEVGGWHNFRHYHASQIIAAGASPVAVARRLGHADASMTLRVYAHMWVDDVSRIVAASDGVVGVGHH